MMYLTLNRKRACIKLKSARRATYFYQRLKGHRFEREVPIEDVVKAFEANSKYKLRISMDGTSEHTIYAAHNKGVSYGYRVEF